MATDWAQSRRRKRSLRRRTASRGVGPESEGGRRGRAGGRGPRGAGGRGAEARGQEAGGGSAGATGGDTNPPRAFRAANTRQNIRPAPPGGEEGGGVGGKSLQQPPP